MKMPWPVLAILFILFAGFAGWTARDLRSSSRVVANWPTVPGMVVASTTEKAFEKTTHANTTSAGLQPTWHAHVVYRYVIDGHEWHGDKIAPLREVLPALNNRPPDRVLAIARRYPVGAAVTVHYSPFDPGRAYLVVGQSSWSVWAGASVFFGFAALISVGLALLR